MGWKIFGHDWVAHLLAQHIATGRVLNAYLFSDADLIGLPLRLTISQRSLKASGVEFKHRVGG